MRLGLHFEIADTPPLLWEKTTDKSEIYQDLVKSVNSLKSQIQPKVRGASRAIKGMQLF